MDGKYDHKVESKKLGYGGYKACVVVKTFLDRDDVLANYESDHLHPVGAANTRFCRVSPGVREFAEGLIRIGLELDKVMEPIDGYVKGLTSFHIHITRTDLPLPQLVLQ